MSDARHTWIDIAKAVGFVLLGTVGVLVALTFVDGFRDGYSGAQRATEDAEQVPDQTSDPDAARRERDADG